MLIELRSVLANVVRRAKEEKSLTEQYDDEVVVGFILAQLQGLIVLRRSGTKLISIERQVELL